MVGAYSIIENETVINRILASLEFMQSLGVEFTDDPTALMGYVRIGGVWTDPNQQEEDNGN